MKKPKDLRPLANRLALEVRDEAGRMYGVRLTNLALQKLHEQNGTPKQIHRRLRADRKKSRSSSIALEIFEHLILRLQESHFLRGINKNKHWRFETGKYE